MADKAICKNCRFYWSEPGMVICRRKPPYVFLVPASTLEMPRTVSIWPGVQDTWWCGEFAPQVESTVVQLIPLDGRPLG